jgi:hypothetical protein
MGGQAMRIIPLLLGAALIIPGPSARPQPADKNKDQVDLGDLITVEFGKKQYDLTQADAAKGVKFRYRIIVKEDLPGMIPISQTSAGIPGPNNLMPLAKLHGGGQLYALLDVGLAPPMPRKPQTIQKGVYEHTLEWDGRNWTGPSDTNNPKGKPFPPGTYTLTVSMIGEQQTPLGLKGYRIAEDAELILKE